MGCYTGSDIEPTKPKSGPSTSVDGTDPANAALVGVPCDVADVLAKRCTGCHGTALTGGAPNALTSYDDLATASKTDPSKSYAQLSIDRINDRKKPMPPEGGMAPAEIAILQKWIADGMPKGDCAAPGSTVDPAIYNTPVQCSSKDTWTRGNAGSSLMHPGVACIDCHEQMGRGPVYSVAGTIYPTAHEPDDCFGSSADVQIIVTGADGRSQTLTPNSAGNFFSRTRVTMPYKVKVVAGGKTREMVGAVDKGDCNACHTEKGTEKAPGRVMAP